MSGERPASSPSIAERAQAAANVPNGADSGSSIEIAIEVDSPEGEPKAAGAPAKKPAGETTPPPPSSTGRLGEATVRMGDGARKARSKVTLKIPDDEIARPQPQQTPVSPQVQPTTRGTTQVSPVRSPHAPVAPTSPPPSAELRAAEARPAEPRPVEARPAEPRPVEARPAEPRPVEARPAEPRPAEARPAEPRPAPDPAAVIVTPMRIISIGPPPSTTATPNAPPVATATVTKGVAPPRPVAAAAPGPAPGTQSTREDSWTPYQPGVGDRPAPSPSLAPPAAVPRPTGRTAPGSSPPFPAAAPIPAVPAPAPARVEPPSPERSVSAAPVAPLPLQVPSTPLPVAPPTERRLPPDVERSGPALRSRDSADDISIDSVDSTDDIDAEPTTSPKGKVPSTPPPAPYSSPFAALAIPPAPPVGVAMPPAAVLPPVAPKDGASSPPVALASTTSPAPPPPVAAEDTDPAASPVDIKNLPPMRAQAQTEPEALEVQFEDEITSPGMRSSEAEAEIAAEDLVSIESVPSPSRAGQPVPVVSIKMDPVPRSVSPAVSARGSMPPPPKSAQPQGKGAARVIVPTASASPIAPPAMTPDHQTARRKIRPWWEELFNDDFIRTMAKISDPQIATECDFIEESLAVAKGAMLLDLACGTGRHAIELTRRGYKVVGFDLSLPMLARAAEEAQERAQKLNFVQGDMREMTFEDTFDGIYCWATSFGFFEEEKNAVVVQKMHKALRKGGQLLLDVVNRDYIIRQAPSLAWFEGDACICMDEMSIDWITSRMKVKRTMMMDDGRTKEIDYSIRVYSLHELGKILHDAGFRVAEVSGRTATPGVFFGAEAPRTMILAEKK